MKVLVTGASGFLGSHIAEQLFAAGHKVRLLLRPTSERRFLGFLYEEANGDVRNAASLPPAVSGVDAIVHAAGLIKARSEKEFASVNEHGTAKLISAAQTSNPGLKQFVYISSLAAHGPSPDGRPRPVHATPEPITAYGRTKLVGELIARESFLGDRSVVFRMPVIYGPRDPALLPFFKLAKMRIAPLLDGGKNRISIIYAEDAARAVVQAIESKANLGGKTYCPEDGRIYTWRDLLTAVESAVGRTSLMLPTPRFAYEAAGYASAGFGRLLRRAVMLTPDKVREMSQQAWVCSSEELQRDLGWKPRIQIEEGARLTYAFYRRVRWL
jgi:nucleoside-diphosphate-sugar epimerase